MKNFTYKLLNNGKKLILFLKIFLGFISPELQWDKTFPVFLSEQQRKQRQRTSELYRSRQRLASIYGRTGKGNPIADRYKLYLEHAENIGNDFIESYKNIIIVNCNNINSDARKQLLKELSSSYSRAVDNAKRADARYLNSEGRPNDLDSFHRPTEHMYYSALSKYRDILISEIKQFNIKLYNSKLESRKRIFTEISTEALKYVISFILGLLFGSFVA